MIQCSRDFFHILECRRNNSYQCFYYNFLWYNGRRSLYIVFSASIRTKYRTWFSFVSFYIIINVFKKLVEKLLYVLKKFHYFYCKYFTLLPPKRWFTRVLRFFFFLIEVTVQNLHLCFIFFSNFKTEWKKDSFVCKIFVSIFFIFFCFQGSVNPLGKRNLKTQI